VSAGSRADHQKFCEHDQWTPVRNARGNLVGHHVTYELSLDDGRILRTRISRPVNADAYGPGLWHAILADQLDVTEEQFWACVRHEVRPERSSQAATDPTAGLPAWLVVPLLNQLHLTSEQVAAMDERQARDALQRHRERQARDHDT
jgi:hypothetical protein